MKVRGKTSIAADCDNDHTFTFLAVAGFGIFLYNVCLMVHCSIFKVPLTQKRLEFETIST